MALASKVKRKTMRALNLLLRYALFPLRSLNPGEEQYKPHILVERRSPNHKKDLFSYFYYANILFLYILLILPAGNWHQFWSSLSIVDQLLRNNFADK